MKWKESNVFELIYIFISVATFTHTTWGSAFVFEGEIPKSGGAVLAWWLLSGVLMAVTVDAGMFLVARALRKNPRSVILIATFVLAAVASYYFQVLYALHHTSQFQYGEVHSYWKHGLQPFIDARVVLVPAILPIFAVLYTIAKIEVVHDEETTMKTVEIHYDGIRMEATKHTLEGSDTPALRSGEDLFWQCDKCGKQYGPYRSEATVKGIMTQHEKNCKHREVAVEGSIVENGGKRGQK